jgi:hypothetical protein
MAAVARPLEVDKGVKEASRRAVATIGRAPRNIVCFRCARKHEIVLGRIDSDKPCARCKKTLRQGVVIQSAARPRNADKRGAA